MDKLNILIIGGTRFFGPDIVNAFLRDGHTVSVLSNADRFPEFASKIEKLQGDRHNRSFLKSIANSRKFDVIVDNIALIGDDVKECLSIFQGKVSHYILTSTAWVYKNLRPAVRAFEEKDLGLKQAVMKPARDIREITQNYIIGKLGCERALIGQTDVSYTIFRPCMATGENDYLLRGYFYIQRLKDKNKIIILEKDKPLQLLYSGDIAAAFQRAAASKTAANQVFNLCPQETITTKRFIEIAAGALNTEPRFCFLSEKMLLSAMPDYLENEPFNFEDDIYSASKIRKELGVSFTPYQKWIKKIALWYAGSYYGQDSAGYNLRRREISLCQ